MRRQPSAAATATPLSVKRRNLLPRRREVPTTLPALPPPGAAGRAVGGGVAEEAEDITDATAVGEAAANATAGDAVGDADGEWHSPAEAHHRNRSADEAAPMEAPMEARLLTKHGRRSTSTSGTKMLLLSERAARSTPL